MASLEAKRRWRLEVRGWRLEAKAVASNLQPNAAKRLAKRSSNLERSEATSGSTDFND